MARTRLVTASAFVALSLPSLACSTPSNDSTSGSAVTASPPVPAPSTPSKTDEEDRANEAPAAPPPPPEPAPATEPAPLEPTKPDIADLCQSLCVQRNQMRAVAEEVIDAECRDRCAKDRDVDPTCVAAAKKFRATLEAKPMRARARRFWTLLADPALSCGADDPVLTGLAAASRNEDPAARTAAMRAQLMADPFLEVTCPAGVEALAKPALQTSVDALVEHCPIANATVGASIHQDLDPVTFLAVEVIRTHWRALGATTGDHEIMLATLLLSTALNHE